VNTLLVVSCRYNLNPTCRSLEDPIPQPCQAGVGNVHLQTPNNSESHPFLQLNACPAQKEMPKNKTQDVFKPPKTSISLHSGWRGWSS